MKPVIPPFRRFTTLLVSNVYLLDGGAGTRWLVDSGHWSERLQLAAELRAAGLRPSDLAGVLLTHRHSDHAGNAAWLQRDFRVKVYAHRADAEILEGTAPRAEIGHGGTLVERAMSRLENRFPAQLRVDRALEAGEVVEGLEVHWVPGHTEGSVLYRHDATKSLLSGDTILTARPPWTRVRETVGPWAPYSVDVAQARASLTAFHAAGFAYDHLLAGHGPPLVGDARERVRAALGD